MQNAAMNNAEKQGEKWAGKAQNAIDRGVSKVESKIESIGDTDLKAVAADFSNKVRDASGEAYRESLDFVKRYPVGSALGLAAVGFLAGVWATRSRN